MEQRLNSILDAALERMGVRTAVRNVQIGELFESIVGEALAPHCRADRIERGTLVIASANSALSHQLQLDSQRIIQAINAALGGEVVRRFRFITFDQAVPR